MIVLVLTSIVTPALHSRPQFRAVGLLQKRLHIVQPHLFPARTKFRVVFVVFKQAQPNPLELQTLLNFCATAHRLTLIRARFAVALRRCPAGWQVSKNRSFKSRPDPQPIRFRKSDDRIGFRNALTATL